MKHLKLSYSIIIFITFLLLTSIFSFFSLSSIDSDKNIQGIIPLLKTDYKDYFDYKEKVSSQSTIQIYSNYKKLSIETMLAIDCFNTTSENPLAATKIVDEYNKSTSSTINYINVDNEINNILDKYSTPLKSYIKDLKLKSIFQNSLSSFFIIILLMFIWKFLPKEKFIK